MSGFKTKIDWTIYLKIKQTTKSIEFASTL